MTQQALRSIGRLPARALAGAMLLAAMVVVALSAASLASTDPFSVAGPALAAPGGPHPFGTDDLGRDVYAGVIHGAWSSLLVGFASATCATLIGLAVGGLAGIRGGMVDHSLMRATELAQAIPRFFLVVMVVSLFGGHLWLIIAVIALTAWPSTARIFRAQVLVTLGRDFVVAARASGSSDLGILLRHVLPITMAVVAAQVASQVGAAILAEAGLSFLGLGDPTVMSWGALLGAAHQTISEAWWIAVFPGVALTLTVLACNLLADALLRDR
ncbi:MAG TPA: ABC transporter permease [Vicinamibacterales bacterium]|nr:ABC transporter permease [Vicinamibacterales bacterium]